MKRTEDVKYVPGYGPHTVNRRSIRADKFSRPEGWGTQFTRRTHQALKARAPRTRQTLRRPVEAAVLEETA